jgi:probable HAF family extracellular repeat protein
VVGTSSVSPERDMHAFRYSGGSMFDISSSAEARAINNLGQIVGGYYGSAFLYRDGTMQDLGILQGCYSSEATGINDRGQIVGEGNSTDGVGHGFFYDNGVMTDIGNLGGSWVQVNAINNAGDVVGTGAGADENLLAFLYSGGNMIDLNSAIDPNSEWNLLQAFDINELGEIVCLGQSSVTGLNRALVLTPIPEPSSLGLMILFGAALWLMRSVAEETGYRPQHCR